jgi:hypothetical protein
MQSVNGQTFLLDISRKVSANFLPERDGTNLMSRESGPVFQLTYTFTNSSREMDGNAKITHANAPITVDLLMFSGLKLIKEWNGPYPIMRVPIAARIAKAANGTTLLRSTTIDLMRSIGIS